MKAKAQGQSYVSWEEANPRELIKRILNDNPEIKLDDLCRVFRARWKRSNRRDDYERSISDCYAINTVAAWQRAKSREENEQNGGAEEDLSTIAERIKSLIKIKNLFKMLTPSGKRLEDCTSEDLMQMGGGFCNLAAHVPPGQTLSEAMDEARARELYVA